MRRNELVHDIAAANELKHFSQPALVMLDAWLARYVARLERRQAMFFGGSDKIALLSITGLVVGLGRQFVDAYDQASRALPQLGVGASNWVGWGLLFILAAITGFALGCMMTGRVIRRTLYQRDLLAIALDAHAGRANSRVVKSDR